MVKEILKSLVVNQVLTKRRVDISILPKVQYNHFNQGRAKRAEAETNLPEFALFTNPSAVSPGNWIRRRVQAEGPSQAARSRSGGLVKHTRKARLRGPSHDGWSVRGLGRGVLRSVRRSER